MPKWEVKQSPIAGSGVFATEAIDATSFVGEYTGEIISAKQFRETGYQERVTLFSLPRGRGLHGTGPLVNMNHSCEPNCRAERRGNRIFFYAITDIPPGKELTFNYNLQGEDAARYICNCGAPSCTGHL